MRQEIKIENLKCGGCANTIVKNISSIEGVSDLTVDLESSTVSFMLTNVSQLENVTTKLASLGYPEAGSKNTLSHKAKSFVSCAVGRVS